MRPAILPMHIKVDEDLPLAIAPKLRAVGYSASTVLEQGMAGWKDPDLWKVVQDHEQFLVTGDKGFGDIRRYRLGSHQGILILRPAEDGIRPFLELIDLVLAQVPDLATLEGLLVVASPQGLRIRRP